MAFAAIVMGVAGCGEKPATDADKEPGKQVTAPTSQTDPSMSADHAKPSGPQDPSDKTLARQQPLERGDKTSVANAKTILMKIDGISEPNDQKEVCDLIMGCDGVGHAVVDIDAATAEITFDEKKTSADKIGEHIAAGGKYKPKLVE